MAPLRIDLAPYSLITDRVLTGLNGIKFVYYLTRCGNNTLQKLSDQTRQKFEMKDSEVLPVEFTGFVVDKEKDGEFYTDQKKYLRKLECLRQDFLFSHFNANALSLANKHPSKIPFEISQMA